MCTVSYIPQPNGFILTSNRDESPDRSPKDLTHVLGSHYQLVYPQDTLAGGTWIAGDNQKRGLSLLNGAFIKHPHRPPYRHSRGVIPIEYFNYVNIEAFCAAFDFEGIEPFTLVVVEHDMLYEIRWDQVNLFKKQLDPRQYYIWSSCTLYDEETQAQRALWFNEWKVNRTNFSLEEIRKFHQFGGESNLENGFVMNRNNVVRTVSISQIQVTSEFAAVYYTELLKKSEDHRIMELIQQYHE